MKTVAWMCPVEEGRGPDITVTEDYALLFNGEAVPLVFRTDAEAAIAKALEWRDAVDAELVTIGSTAESFPDARTAVKAAIDWYVAVALDPAVSSDAAKIRDDALEEAARIVDGSNVDFGNTGDRIRALKGKP